MSAENDWRIETSSDGTSFFMLQFGTKPPQIKTPQLQRSLWFFVQVVAFLAPLFALNNAARAESCGHYLFRNGVPVQLVSAADAHSSHAHSLVMPFQYQAARTHNAGVPTPRNAPCNGPGCKNRSKPTLPGSSPVTLSVTTDPAILASHLLMCGCLDEATAVLQSEKGGLLFANTIFRPPAC